MELSTNEMCFACGSDNPIGLRLAFHFDGDEYVTSLAVKPEHQGWAGWIHGGLLATALDEVMTRLLRAKGLNAVTGRLEVRYRRPVPVGAVLEVRGRIVRQRRLAIETAAVATIVGGAPVAEATALFLQERRLRG
jgi:acyl-coenzyme A thioesterase PaaI-like protein